ncbi:MAG: tRNA cyclic N6-threonylcarbamoyladenosine(37) synthase TcdA [Firmicutes bacterium HGW-Firmicutes-15]|nr:MAG: tRNA cyclic N6-threonylcarbamoyladenosine(37) synthase TcdA [Firmicutes bacterium HGW-Firmicutes-15]
MNYEFSRTELLIGREAVEKLGRSTVAIFGIGGVGSFAVEGLVRSGVGKLVLIDDDCICLTNINRQLHATSKTVGKPKVEVMKDRILEINPKAEVITHQTFYMPEHASQLVTPNYDYIIDAIDTVTAKIDLILNAKALSIPIISCMGAGNKLDPTRFEIADIYDTSVCPLAKVMRRELRKRGINDLKVVYSKEEPIKPMETDESSCQVNCICPKGSARTCTSRRQTPGSIAFVPSVAGLLIAGEVVKDLIKTTICSH